MSLVSAGWERAGGDDAGVGLEALEVGGELGIEEDSLVSGRGVHEAEGAMFIANGEANVGAVDVVFVGDDADDIAVLKERFGSGDVLCGEVVEGLLFEFDFDGAHAGEKGGVVLEVAVAFPEDGHFIDSAFAFEGNGGAEFRSEDVDVAASGIVGEPLVEIVNAIEVVAVADAIAVTCVLDFGKKVGWGGLSFCVTEESCDGEDSFEEGPAVQAIEVDGRGLNGVVDLKGETGVRSSVELLGDASEALGEGEAIPGFAFGLLKEALVFGLTNEGGRKWKVLGGRGVGAGKKQGGCAFQQGATSGAHAG